MLPYVNIHTHRPTGSGIELRTAGVHPWDAATQDAATLGQRLGGAQAVGETGLDFVRGADRAAQLSALRTQLRLARERGLPVVLHCVRAFEPLMRELAASEPRAVIFHGFIGRRGRPWQKVTASRSANARSHRPRPLRRCAGRRFRSSFWRPTTAPCPSRKFTPGRRRRKGCRRRCCNGQF